MKKAKLLVLTMLSSMIITGCGAKAQFKDVTVKEQLTNAEKAVLLIRIQNALKEKLSGYTVKTSDYRKTAINDDTQETVQTVTLFDGYYVHGEQTVKTETKSNGLITKDEDKTVFDAFRLNDKYIATYQVDEKDEVTVNVNEGVGEDVYAYGLAFVNDLNQMTAYKDAKDNISFVSNQYNETYQPDQAYFAESKVLHNIEKRQTVVEIDKEYKIKSYYQYRSVESNRDPDTFEYGKKTTVYQEQKTSADISYKARKSNDNGYADMKNEILNKYVFVNQPTLKAKVGDDEIQLNKQLVNRKRLGYAKTEYTYSVSFNVGVAPLNENKTIILFVEGNIKKAITEDNPENVKINVSEVNLSGKVDFAVAQQVELLVQYTIETSADKAVNSASNVSIYLL